MSNIFALLIKSKEVNDLMMKERSVDNEVNGLILNLGLMKKEMRKCAEETDYTKISESVLDISSSFIVKLEYIPAVDRDLVDKLVLERCRLEDCVKAQRDMESAPSMVFYIAKLIKEILYCIPAGNL